MSILPDAGLISFARGIPSPDLFPLEQLAESAARAVSNHGRVALNYGASAGYSPLREWVGHSHATAPERVLVMPGSLIGLNFLVAHLSQTGGCAVVEAPTYDRMLNSLRGRMEICCIVRNDDGVDLDQLGQLMTHNPRPRFLYVLPTFHNPTGRTMGILARESLAAFADEHDLLVFEDDPYGLLRIDGTPQPLVYDILRERGRDDLAVYSSSFSKTVAPGLRVGYLLLPDELVSPISALAIDTYVSPPLLPQAQLFEFLSAGYFEPHLDFVRSSLREKRDMLLTTFDEEMPAGTRWTQPEGGYFLWLELPEPLDALAIDAAAREAGVTFVPGRAFFPDDRGLGTARVSFSYPPIHEIRDGAKRLATTVHAALDGRD